MSKRTTAVLETGLFCGDEELRSALAQIPAAEQTRVSLTAVEQMTDQDWDELLKLVLTASVVVTV